MIDPFAREGSEISQCAGALRAGADLGEQCRGHQRWAGRGDCRHARPDPPPAVRRGAGAARAPHTSRPPPCALPLARRSPSLPRCRKDRLCQPQVQMPHPQFFESCMMMPCASRPYNASLTGPHAANLLHTSRPEQPALHGGRIAPHLREMAVPQQRPPQLASHS